MMMQDLDSSHFSDEKRYKIYWIWSYGIKDMNYAILLNLIQILIMFKFYLSKNRNKVHIWKVHEMLILKHIKFVEIGIRKVQK